MNSSHSSENFSRKKMCLENKEKDLSNLFTPREYQIEILESARHQNTIACLGTGTGKTFIAVMLIRENTYDIHKPYVEDGKRIFFLVPTVPLVLQQAKTISEHTDLKVKGYFGEMDVDSWEKDQWLNEFNEYEVLVMTAEIFRIIILHNFIPISKIQLLIFDECHRAQGNHPYREAMKFICDQEVEHMPKIFGLSASLLNGKCKPIKLDKHLQDLEKTLRSTITTASDIIDLQKYGTDPTEYVIFFKGDSSCINQSLARDIMDQIQKLNSDKNLESLQKDHSIFSEENVKFFEHPLKCLKQLLLVLQTLGTWCACRAAEIFCSEVKALRLRPYNENYIQMLTSLEEFLHSFSINCKSNECYFNSTNLLATPKKLLRLLELFSQIKTSKRYVCSPNEHQLKDNFGTFQNLAEEATNSNVTVCSIIFVEQRITAYVLCQWMLEVASNIPEYNFIKPNYIVGHGATSTKSDCNKTNMTVSKQKNILHEFREKKFNVLIATSVLEEGMDIQQCNVVVRFDVPPDFRSYIQSKGRARAKNSIYVLLVDLADNKKFLDDMCNFKTIEKMLLSKCINRSIHLEEDIQDHMADDFVPPYMPYGKDGPRVTLTSSVSLINRYCANLPCDMSTKLTPRWKLINADPDTMKNSYYCELWMPINSPLRTSITGETLPKKKLAKMSAALKACQMLHEKGELNEHLVPVSTMLDKALREELSVFEDEVPIPGTLPGTNRRRQIYKKKVPFCLSQCKPLPLTPCYLHVFEMDLTVPLPASLNPRNRILINPSESTRGFALLSTKRLPKVCAFPLFSKSGKVMINVETSESILMFSKEEILLLEKFHKFIFSDVLWLENGKQFSPETAERSCYIAPINKGQDSSSFEIDWNFMETIRYHKYEAEKLQTLHSRERTEFNEELFKDAVLLRSYEWNDKNEVPTFHYVQKILDDMSPKSSLDGKKYESFVDYYKMKYGIDIENCDQPLVETVRSGTLSMWKPIYVSAKEIFAENVRLSNTKMKHKNYREYLVPELCIIHPFPVSLFNKALFLPTILFRLSSLLLAEELRQDIAEKSFMRVIHVEENFQWPDFHLETSDRKLVNQLVAKGDIREQNYAEFIPKDVIKEGSKIVSFEIKVDSMNNPGPCPSLVLQALTTKGAGDEFNLERLEMIGDSFLKYVISVKLFSKYPHFDEGKLSKLRISLIRNLYLYQCGKKRNIAEYFVSSCFDCNRAWLPPCYTMEEQVDARSLVVKTKKEKQMNKDCEEIKPEDRQRLYFKQQIISDKCIADSVEALIGAYLLSSGQIGALKFMHWLGINHFSNVETGDISMDSFENWLPVPPDPIISKEPNVKQSLDRLTSGYENFEKTINYQFKNRAYLLQAFTHPSYSYNGITDCYQRLEFLGDAVLDYLVTRQLFENPKNHSPGELTDLRAALVNNIYFASLAIKFGYNKFLHILSPMLFKLLQSYIRLLENSKAFHEFQVYGYYLEEVECFELEEVEVPKALGDIFESVAGAIYLDSGMSLDAVWNVYYPMMQPAIDHMSVYVPKSPVRLLFEELNTKNIFGKAEEKDGKTWIEVLLPNGKKIRGVGPNKKVAKRSAAKRAVVELRKKNKHKEAQENQKMDM